MTDNRFNPYKQCVILAMIMIEQTSLCRYFKTCLTRANIKIGRFHTRFLSKNPNQTPHTHKKALSTSVEAATGPTLYSDELAISHLKNFKNFMVDGFLAITARKELAQRLQKNYSKKLVDMYISKNNKKTTNAINVEVSRQKALEKISHDRINLTEQQVHEIQLEAQQLETKRNKIETKIKKDLRWWRRIFNR